MTGSTIAFASTSTSPIPPTSPTGALPDQRFPFVPDNMLRDHRKIAFYDLTELDPARGEAIYTGMGVGDHYAGPTWDDRALLARGPAVLPVKIAARELPLSQGFDEKEIPPPSDRFPDRRTTHQRLAALHDRAGTEWGSRCTTPPATVPSRPMW